MVVGIQGLTHPRSEDVGYDGTCMYVERISLCTAGGWSFVMLSDLLFGPGFQYAVNWPCLALSRIQWNPVSKQRDFLGVRYYVQFRALWSCLF